jgi:hypothetical protein
MDITSNKGSDKVTINLNSSNKKIFMLNPNKK